MQIDKVKKNITIIIVSHKGREKVIKFVIASTFLSIGFGFIFNNLSFYLKKNQKN